MRELRLIRVLLSVGFFFCFNIVVFLFSFFNFGNLIIVKRDRFGFGFFFIN